MTFPSGKLWHSREPTGEADTPIEWNALGAFVLVVRQGPSARYSAPFARQLAGFFHALLLAAWPSGYSQVCRNARLAKAVPMNLDEEYPQAFSHFTTPCEAAASSASRWISPTRLRFRPERQPAPCSCPGHNGAV
jgi:hypothetical protein